MALDMTTALTIRAKVTGQQEITGLAKGLDGVTRASNNSSTAMGRLKGATAGALGAVRTLLPAIGVGAVAKFAKDNLDAADAMSKLSLRTGIAAPTLDKFRKVAELSDTSIEGLSKAFTILAKNSADAAEGSGPAADAFAKLGIDVTDAGGKLRTTDAIFLDIADRFAQLADGTDKAALASDIFGSRLGSQLIPLLNSGGDAVRNMSTALTQDFADRAAAFNDRLENMQEQLQQLDLFLTTALLPVLEALVGVFEQVGGAFSKLPEPLQKITASVIALSAAWGLLGPIVAPLIGLLKGLAALKIGATIAGWAGAIGPLLAGLKALGALIAAVFTGPVGWIVLLVAAGVAIYTFRDQIGNALETIASLFQSAFEAISGLLQSAAKAYFDFYVKPVLDLAEGAYNGILGIFSRIGQAVKGPFIAAANVVKSVFQGVLKVLTSILNAWIRRLNFAINLANNLPFIDLDNVPTFSVPQFAKGGVVGGPTLAMVGEGGEREYIVPESKMARASANYLAGMRGGSVIPAFADGGVVGPSGGGGAANTTVQITTGPVLQQDGQRYVTVGDLERALQDFGEQVFRNSRSYGGRRYQGAY
jgi:phage-related protein